MRKRPHSGDARQLEGWERVSARAEISRSSDALRQLLSRCESPIEKLLLVGLWSLLPKRARITPQAPVGPFRADFLIEQGSRRLLIECDGGAFHAGDLRQAADRARDDYFRASGYEVIRVTGQEINQHPRSAARRVVKYLREIKGGQ